jgi:hypothetical protein
MTRTTKAIIVACVLSLGGGFLLGYCTSGCTFDPCPGQQECSDGTCAPVGNVCCGNGTSCPSGYICGPNDCIGGVITTAESCLSIGQEPCVNSDGTIDCAPLGAECCSNHKNCTSGYCCSEGCCN